MKTILVEIDDRSARDLERVAPAKKRRRAQFIRHAIRHGIDLALDRKTAEAYAVLPLAGDLSGADLAGWDEGNTLARPALARTKARPRGKKADRVA